MFTLSYGQAPTSTASSGPAEQQNVQRIKTSSIDKHRPNEPSLENNASPSNGETKTGTAPREHDNDSTGYGWLAETLLAFFTAGLFVATWLLARSTERLVKGAEHTAERQLRAYVGIEEGKISITAGNALNGIIVMKNYGQTPAYDVRVRTITGIFEDREPLNFPENGQETIYSIIGGGGKFNLHPSTNTLTSQKIAGIRVGTNTVFVWGKVTYRDVFKKEWGTEFRVTLGITVGVDTWGLKPCSEGNTAT